MFQIDRSILTHRRLVLFKWLMVFVPSVIVMVGHNLLEHSGSGDHTGSTTQGLPADLFVTFVGLALTYIFVETLFRVLWRLQSEALLREQDIRTMSAVMQERERMSRELHDGAAQLIAHLLVRLDTIKQLVETNRPQEAGVELERLHAVADEIYQDIGESITGLRTNVMEQGLLRALRDYVDRFEERHQIHTSLRGDDVADRLSPLAALQLFRFVQEALTNVRKHAEARAVTVTFVSDASGQLKVVIADDGQGFIAAPAQNGKTRPLGLTSMRERVESLGGSFQVTSQPGQGTQVIAIIPLSQTRWENAHATIATPTR